MSLTVEIRAILRRMAIAARRLVIDPKASHYPILEQDRLAFDPAETLSPMRQADFILSPRRQPLRLALSKRDR
jgi:hypothetical protein